MAAIDQIISVNITADTVAVATDSFAIPIIVGTAKGDDGKVSVATYTSPADLLDDGYEADDAEYVSAVALCSGAIRPGTFQVAKRSASGSIDADLAAIFTIDNTAYGIVFAGGLSDADIVAAATAVEGLTKIAVFASKTPAIATDATDDVLSQLKAKSLSRSALIFSPGSADKGIDAGIVGSQLPKQPGSTSWAYKTIAGIAADPITATQANNVLGVPVAGQTGKHGNVYQQVGGVNVFMPGMMASGQFIDVTIGTDSLKSVIKSNIMQAFVGNEKIPYTEAGCTIIEQCIRSAIQVHQGYGFLDTDITTVSVKHTPVINVTATRRAQRIAPDFVFGCRTSGAMHAVSIQGTVSV